MTDRPPPTQFDFDAVYERELDYVWITLRRLGVRPRDLEDLAHDVFVIVFRKQGEFDLGRAVRPWLFGIAFRVASDYRRSARFRHEVDGVEVDVADEKPTAEDQLALLEKRKLVLAALETMDLDRRAVFLMHDLDGHPMPQIQEALGVRLNTLYSRLRLARQDFAAAVRRILAREGDR